MTDRSGHAPPKADDTRFRQGRGGEPPATASELGGGVTLQASVRSDPEEVRCALERLLGALQALGMSRSEAANTEIVLAEAMNNIVEHAYHGSESGWLGLRTDLFPDRLLCRIEDGGAPMPDLQLPAGTRQDLDVDPADLPEGGFGWLMIRALTTDLRYCRAKGLNRLSFAVLRKDGSGI